MKYILSFMIMLIGLLALPAPAMSDEGLAEAVASYRLGVGDRVRIQVYQEDDLSIEADIRPDGTIAYPLLGEVKLAGLTLDEAIATLDKRLRGDYLVNPRITMTIAQYRPIFVAGEVKSPGSYEYQPGMTVRQAIVLAGGLTDRASRNKIYLIREGSSELRKVKLHEKLHPGDTITVKEGFF